MERGGRNEAQQVQRGADHRDIEGAGGWRRDGGCMPAARGQQRDFFQVEGQVWGGLEVSRAKCLRQLEDEHSKLKKLLAEAMLDIAMLKEITPKNGSARR